MSKDLASVEYQEAVSLSDHASHSGLPDPSGSSSANSPVATRDTANDMRGAESLSSTVQDILDELRQLSQALKSSGRVCDCQDSGNGKELPAAPAVEANVQQRASTPRSVETGAAALSSNREKFQAEFLLLDETCRDISQTRQAKEEFLKSLKRRGDIQWLKGELLARFQRPEPAPSEETRRWFDSTWSMGQEKCLLHDEEAIGRTKWYPEDPRSFASDDAVS